MPQFTLTIHLQTDDIASVLEPLARHLDHIEVAIDYDDPQPKRVHPAVEAVIDADREAAADLRAAKRQLERRRTTTNARLEHQAAYKREARAKMSRLSPLVIDAVPCPKCFALVKQPCRSNGQDFGRTGHTHLARREAYANKKEQK